MINTYNQNVCLVVLFCIFMVRRALYVCFYWDEEDKITYLIQDKYTWPRSFTFFVGLVVDSLFERFCFLWVWFVVFFLALEYIVAWTKSQLFSLQNAIQSNWNYSVISSKHVSQFYNEADTFTIVSILVIPFSSYKFALMPAQHVAMRTLTDLPVITWCTPKHFWFKLNDTRCVLKENIS